MRTGGLAGLACLFVVASSMAVAAQEETRGEQLFVDFCAPCHGSAATAYDPVSSGGMAAADLTELSRLKGGRFPLRATVAHLEGQHATSAKGGAMPQFAEVLGAAEADTVIRDEVGAEITTSRAIADLIGFLRTIQE